MRTLRLLALLTGVIGWLVLSPAVSAHAKLDSSNPPDGAVIPAPPGQVVVTFSEDIDPNGTTLTVVGPDGNPVSSAQTQVSVNAPKTARVAMTGSGNGSYQVKWHAVADDDKGVTEGTFKFTVGNAPSNTTGGTATSGGVSSGNGSALLIGVGALVILVLVAAALLLRRSARRGA